MTIHMRFEQLHGKHFSATACAYGRIKDLRLKADGIRITINRCFHFVPLCRSFTVRCRSRSKRHANNKQFHEPSQAADNFCKWIGCQELNPKPPDKLGVPTLST